MDGRGLRRGWLLGVAVSAITAAPAWAGDKPVYQPAPDWIAPAPAIDPAELTDDAPVLLRLDRQDRLADGVVSSYADVATRMASPEVVAHGGTISLSWEPGKGDLVVHQVEILRGAQRIDLLAAGKRFEVIRREQQLERSQIDGTLTATMAVSDLRVGDVLHVATTTTVHEGAFPTLTQAALPLPLMPGKIGYTRARLLWPANADVRWRSYPVGGAPVVSSAGGMREVSLVGLLPKAADLPNDAPLRFRRPPLLEATSFADWTGVSRANAPLYRTDGLVKPGGPLAGEIARIAAATADPLHRTSAALQLVQEKVRYLAVTLDNGGYVPQSPEQTWSTRYGDCKAKTLLLLAMLRSLGVEAEPVLAASQGGDFLPERLPGTAAFDHVLVRASIGGQPYWLDGTGSGSRFEDLADAPPLHWVLPIRAEGPGLIAVPARAPARAAFTTALDLDQSAGITLPTLVHAVFTIRGQGAEMIGLAKSQGSKEQKDAMVGGLVGSLVGTEVGLAGYAFDYDPVTGVGMVDATGLVTTRWHRRDGRYRLTLDHTVTALTFEPDRARDAWRAIPVATGVPQAQSYRMRVRLPGDVAGVTLDGDQRLATTLGPATIDRRASIADGWITVDETVSSSGAEIAAADVPAMRAKVALAKTRLLEAVAPAGMPSRWSTAAAGRADGRFKPILATYAREIADDPKEVSGYVNRANFLLGIYDWRGAMPDLDKAIGLEPSVDLYLRRALTRRRLGETALAAADAKAALALDPASPAAVQMLGELDIDAGHRDAAIARVQPLIDAGGEARPAMVGIKADLLARAGDSAAALATLDEAIAAKPGMPQLLNSRCWIKGEANTALDTALKDCTHAIELSDSAAQILDSRALVYFRLGRMDEAMADIDSVLDLVPDMTSSLYLRGVIRARQGRKALAAEDMAAVKLMDPLLIGDRQRFGIVP